MKKILIWIGSRANFGRLQPLIGLLSAKYSVYLILGDYTLPSYYIQHAKILGTIPNLLYSDKRETMSLSVSIVTQSVSALLQEHFDLAIVHGDRFENLGFAIACSYKGIPLLHTEGGEETGQIDNKVRNAITALSDFHCATSELATNRLIIRGYNAFNTGSVAIDHVRNTQIAKRPMNVQDYVLSLFNPSDDDNYDEYANAMMRIAEYSKVFWVSPNNDPGWRTITKKMHRNSAIVHINTLPPNQFYQFLRRCKCLVGNTSSGIKEGAYLGVPYILVGNRQGNRETGPNAVRVPCISRDIINSVLDIPRGTRYSYDGLFGIGWATLKVCKVIDQEVFKNEN